MYSWKLVESILMMNLSSGGNVTCPREQKYATYTIGIVSFTANFLICFIFAYYQKIRTVNNYFVFNLAISDMLLVLQLCLYETLPTTERSVRDFMRIFEIFCSTASIATLVVISYDRHYSVTKPLHYTGSIFPRKAVLFIGCIWLYASAIALLRLVVYLPNKDLFKYGYVPLLILCNAAIPFSITVYCYSTIFVIASRHLRHNPHQSQDSNSPVSILTKNLKIALHILVLVAPPVLYWSAFYSIGVTEVYCGSCINVKASCLGNWFISMTPNVLAMIDPIIYMFLTKDFRKIIFSWFKRRNRQLFVGETFQLSTTKAITTQASPASTSERRFLEM